jgi:excisionase family DNA binding protein
LQKTYAASKRLRVAIEIEAPDMQHARGTAAAVQIPDSRRFPLSYLTAAEAAKLTRRSVRSIHELTRSGRIPHRRPAGTLRCLFVEDELDAWMDGAELEVVDAGGSRVVRPIAAKRAA